MSNILESVVCTTKDLPTLPGAQAQFLDVNNLVRNAGDKNSEILVINDFDEFFRNELSVFVKLCGGESYRNFLKSVFLAVHKIDDHQVEITSHLANGHCYRSSHRVFTANFHNIDDDFVVAVPYEIAELIVKNKQPKHSYHNWIIVRGHCANNPFIASYQLSLNADVWAYSLDCGAFGTDKPILTISGLTKLYNQIKTQNDKYDYAAIKLDKFLGIANMIKGFTKTYKRPPILMMQFTKNNEFSVSFKYDNEKNPSGEYSTAQILNLPLEKMIFADKIYAVGCERAFNVDILLDLLGNDKKYDQYPLYIKIDPQGNNIYFKFDNGHTEMIVARFVS